MNPENVFCPHLDCPARGQVVKAFGFDERTVKNWWQRAPFARPPATHPTRWGHQSPSLNGSTLPSANASPGPLDAHAPWLRVPNLRWRQD